MPLTTFELVYLGVWAFIGSVLGFLSFGYTPSKSPRDNFCRGVLSVGVGLFLAFPICLYLEETKHFTRHMNILISGLGAFGLPDFVMKWYPKLIQAIAARVVDKTIGDGMKTPNNWTEEKAKSSDKDITGIG